MRVAGPRLEPAHQARYRRILRYIPRAPLAHALRSIEFSLQGTTSTYYRLKATRTSGSARNAGPLHPAGKAFTP